MTLDNIWAKIQHDDTTAFELLYHLLYPGMCQYASQLLGDRQVAEEVVQDVFLKVWNKRGDIFSRDGSIKKYFFRLVHNQCLDVLRKYSTHRESLVQLLPSETWAKISEKYGFDEFLIEKLEVEETVVKIRKIVDQLPAQCREIFIKSRLENMGNKEIAAEMNLSEHTIKTQIYRALQKIKEHFYIFPTFFLRFL
ncbi:MAG: RNA polymerase sigma-70 factor [Bacteroidales bacterium]|jgi:RNA polymerase sigma-70 factor (ECF subfamily)|nr:RNA polymerase sigma-70 factor [Bacteroidales bacterium]